MQGLFGRFGKKNPNPSVSPANPRQKGTLSQSEIDEPEFPTAGRFDVDEDEETNWDDAETLADENNPIIYAQPIVPVVAPPTVSTATDLEDWDEALPAATVKNSNIQEVRRGKNPPPVSSNVDIWEEDLPDRQFSSNRVNSTDRLGVAAQNEHRSIPPQSVSSNLNKAIGLWSAMLQQFRRFLPAPIRQLSDAILTAIVVMLITLSIWIVDGLFVPNSKPAVAIAPSPPAIVQPDRTLPTATPIVASAPEISPEQSFIEAIQSQLSDVTSQYPDDIIQTLNVDVARDRAIVRLNPVWYLIDDDRQNTLTDRMWLQAKANHFTKLELQDADGQSIARSPVVGKHMLILQRRQSY
jgi:hypothetical protein